MNLYKMPSSAFADLPEWEVMWSKDGAFFSQIDWEFRFSKEYAEKAIKSGQVTRLVTKDELLADHFKQMTKTKESPCAQEEMTTYQSKELDTYDVIS